MDAKNAFNDINHIGMCWAVRQLWPSEDYLFLNSYRHWSSLVQLNSNVMDRFMHSGDDMTQGYPVVMESYGIGVLALIK